MVTRRRLRRWGWLLRYWVLDKHRGVAQAVASGALFGVALFGGAASLREPVPGEPVQALAWFWWLVIALVAALLVSALVPKPPPPDPQEGKAPESKDGKQLVRIYGSVWIDDPAIVGWVNNAPEPIRRRSGKK